MPGKGCNWDPKLPQNMMANEMQGFNEMLQQLPKATDLQAFKTELSSKSFRTGSTKTSSWVTTLASLAFESSNDAQLRHLSTLGNFSDDLWQSSTAVGEPTNFERAGIEIITFKSDELNYHILTWIRGPCLPILALKQEV